MMCPVRDPGLDAFAYSFSFVANTWDRVDPCETWCADPGARSLSNAYILIVFQIQHFWQLVPVNELKLELELELGLWLKWNRNWKMEEIKNWNLKMQIRSELN